MLSIVPKSRENQFISYSPFNKYNQETRTLKIFSKKNKLHTLLILEFILLFKHVASIQNTIVYIYNIMFYLELFSYYTIFCLKII